MIRSDFDVLVGLDVLQRVFEAEHDGRGERDFLVGAGGTHVGELFRLGYVDNKVVVLGMFSDDLSGIYFLAGRDEKPATRL